MIRARRRWARLATIWIPGAPEVKKNRQEIRRSKKPRFSKAGVALPNQWIAPNKEYEAWAETAVYYARIAWSKLGRREPVGAAGEQVWLAMRFHLPPRSAPDQSNLYEGVQDVLQDAGVLSNDYWVVSHDGSDRVRAKAAPGVEVVVYACAR